jgi:hypothetical protein
LLTGLVGHHPLTTLPMAADNCDSKRKVKSLECRGLLIIRIQFVFPSSSLFVIVMQVGGLLFEIA